MAILYAQNIYKNGWRVYEQKCRHYFPLSLNWPSKYFVLTWHLHTLYGIMIRRKIDTFVIKLSAILFYFFTTFKRTKTFQLLPHHKNIFCNVTKHDTISANMLFGSLKTSSTTLLRLLLIFQFSNSIQPFLVPFFVSFPRKNVNK